jgi:Flp pilus assembly protein TadG
MFTFRGLPKAGDSLALASRFSRREDGSYTVFGLFVFCTMLLVGGLAVDVMRFEAQRVRMQGVTDRAVLAATMLGENTGNITPEQLLVSYFTAGGFGQFLGNNYTITESALLGRQVFAAPSTEMPTIASNMIGISDLPVHTGAGATENAISGWLDIVMVLDISGSMGFNGGTRIAALRNAAGQMAQQLLSQEDDGRISITLVPYDTAVLPPPTMLPFFRNIHGSVGECPDFRNWNSVFNSIHTPMDRRPCHTDGWAMIRPYMDDAVQAVGAIYALQPRDVTSIDLGMRWGAIFFDPTLRPAITQMINDGLISERFRGRPFDWNEPNVTRAVILMTDGENCCGHRNPQFRQDMNTRGVCNALKQRGVLIYTIALEAPPAGQNLMMQCASSPAHYFDANSGSLTNVFNAIRAHVVTQTLRLTQ